MPGVGLSEEGRTQSERLARSLSARAIAAVISSPLQRARETAAPLARALGLPVLIEAGLDEIDFGAWTGLDFASLERRADWQAWNRFRSFAPCPEGETMVAAQARALAAIGRLAAAHRDAELVLVSHGDVLKAVLAHFLGVTLDLFGRIALDPAHRCSLRLFETEVVVTGVNLPP